MPMMFGFSGQRRLMLEEEARRIAGELMGFGALRAYLIGDLSRGTVGPESELELVIVQETDEPFHRRADFWVAHIRPRVGTRFLVYTPEEVDTFGQDDALLLEALGSGEALVG